MSSKINLKLYEDNNLVLEEKNIIVTDNEFILENVKNRYIINDSNSYYERESDDYIFHLDIISKRSTIFLKKEAAEFPVNVEYIKYEKSNNKNIIEYQLETNDNKNTIIIEEL